MQLFEALSMHVAAWLDEWNKLRKQGKGLISHSGVRRLAVEKAGASSSTPKSLQSL
jgi:hypothetical protein